MIDDSKRLQVARELVAEQAMDDGLWHIPWSASEAYLQSELRRLHEVIEGKLAKQCAEETLAGISAREGGAKG